MFELSIIRNETDYQKALEEFETYFDNEPSQGSSEADRFELLGMILARYEEEQFPSKAPDPVQAIEFAMERLGYTQKDLGNLLGSRSRASEILSRKRDLALPHIRLLHNEWRIPANDLISEGRREA